MLAFAPLVALLGLSASLFTQIAADRDTTYPACDTPHPVHPNKTKTGVAVPFEISDDKVFYLAPGLGSCGVNYTDTDYVACLAPGWMGSAYHSHCKQYVAVADAETGEQIIAQALDTCGAVANSTFGCNDIYLSKIAFQSLGGNTTLGRLTSNVTWNFIVDDGSSGGSGGKCKSKAKMGKQGKRGLPLAPLPNA